MVYMVDEDKDSTCYAKARRKGEQTFTLRSQDKSAPATICKWITANIETASPEKLHEALDSALKMRDWKNRKAAD